MSVPEEPTDSEQKVLLKEGVMGGTAYAHLNNKVPNKQHGPTEESCFRTQNLYKLCHRKVKIKWEIKNDVLKY